jgi:hypothetical protein
MKVKRNDTPYKAFLFFHFVTFLVLADIAAGIGNLRAGYSISGYFAFLRIGLWLLGAKFGLQLREVCAKLQPERLSEFLCQSVLVRGATAIGPMLFFSFEAVSCFISRASIDDGLCENTSDAAKSLSVYVAILTIMSVVTKTMPISVQREASWEYSNLATTLSSLT